MGWGIDFNADIFLSKQEYGNNMEQVKDAIEDDSNTINTINNKINMFASA